MKTPTSIEDAPYNHARWTDEQDEPSTATPPRPSNWPNWLLVAVVIGGGVAVLEKYGAGPSRSPAANVVARPPALSK